MEWDQYDIITLLFNIYQIWKYFFVVEVVVVVVVVVVIILKNHHIIKVLLLNNNRNSLIKIIYILNKIKSPIHMTVITKPVKTLKII